MKLKLTKIILCLACLFSTSACYYERSNYLNNRASDLIEVAHLDMTFYSFGALGNIGPIMLGVYQDSGRHMLGAGGVIMSEKRFGGSGIIFPLGYVSNGLKSKNSYKDFTPPILSLGFDIAFILGIGAHADPVEALDFILGIFTLDLLGDDVYPKTLEEIAIELRSEDVAIRKNAVWALKGRVEDIDRAIPLLRKALKDKDSAVRSHAIYILGTLGGREGFDLIKKARNDKDSSVRCSVIWQMRRGGEEAFKLLAKALEDKDSEVRYSAITALRDISEEGSVKLLARALKDKDIFIRSCAASSLATIGSVSRSPKSNIRQNVKKILGKALEDKDNSVRWACLDFFRGQYKDTESRDILINYLGRETDKHLRNRVLKILKNNFPEDEKAKKLLKENQRGD